MVGKCVMLFYTLNAFESMVIFKCTQACKIKCPGLIT